VGRGGHGLAHRGRSPRKGKTASLASSHIPPRRQDQGRLSIPNKRWVVVNTSRFPDGSRELSHPGGLQIAQDRAEIDACFHEDRPGLRARLWRRPAAFPRRGAATVSPGSPRPAYELEFAKSTSGHERISRSSAAALLLRSTSASSAKNRRAHPDAGVTCAGCGPLGPFAGASEDRRRRVLSPITPPVLAGCALSGAPSAPPAPEAERSGALGREGPPPRPPTLSPAG